MPNIFILNRKLLFSVLVRHKQEHIIIHKVIERREKSFS